jgi:hypothetical protein
MSEDPTPRCGDVVLYRPTGEQLLVAYVDEDTGRLAWAGYPAGLAPLRDCELLAPATEEMHQACVQQWRDVSPGAGDPRRDQVLKRYGTPEERAA